MDRLERQKLIDEILEKLRSGPNKKWSLGSSWLQAMSDEELQNKHDEVLNNE